ncbi:MAG: hypothetical protein K2X43_16125 [Hyphomonadaceae bacterium]|nr:hypothetical protein [Hyphomonadaceae bacterium]
MKEEVLQALAIAAQFAAHATYAGTQRQAIADGYSAVDAVFSALLTFAGTTPPRNHKAKLDAVKARFPKLLDGYTISHENGVSFAGGTTWDEIEEFYRQWLKARYETFDVSPTVARRRVAETVKVLDFAVRQLAAAAGLLPEAVKQLVDERAFGSNDCRLYEALSNAHDHLFDEAERWGEEQGNKLAAKMGAATNFSSLDLVASDDLTREIVRSDEAIARECATLHVRLCGMIEMLRARRRDTLEERGLERREANNEATSFMFALRFKYHGEKQSESAENLGKALALTFRSG